VTALSAYEALAPAYDTLTADYRHDRWLERIERVARRHGLSGRRLLDVACGTGRSFLPLVERGYEAIGCDISPAMVERARTAAGEAAEVFVADMRTLGAVGEFDLLTCLDDSVNYLLTDAELRGAFAGFRANLAPDGIAVWDTNTLLMHRTAFATGWIRDGGDVFIGWQGRTASDMPVGGTAEAVVDVFLRDGDRWERSSGLHQQRHWPLGAVIELAEEAGLRVLEVLGQSEGANLGPRPDEAVHRKLLFFACRNDREEVAT
jgi:SAM-dependent methyltransferase